MRAVSETTYVLASLAADTVAYISTGQTSGGTQVSSTSTTLSAGMLTRT